MPNLSITINLHLKEDIDAVVSILKRQGIERPVYLTELPGCYQITFDDIEEFWEIDDQLSELFTAFEFSDDPSSHLHVRLSIRRRLCDTAKTLTAPITYLIPIPSPGSELPVPKRVKLLPIAG